MIYNDCDVIRWKHFLRYCETGIHRSPVDSPHKEAVTQTFDVSMFSAWTKIRVNMTVIWRRHNDYCTIDLIVASTERLRQGGDVENRCVKVVLFTVIYSCRARNKKKMHIYISLTDCLCAHPCVIMVFILHIASQLERWTLDTLVVRHLSPYRALSIYTLLLIFSSSWWLTSSIENISRLTGPLCGECHRWIPLKNASSGVFVGLRRSKRLSKQSCRRWLCRHCNDLVRSFICCHMFCFICSLCC